MGLLLWGEQNEGHPLSERRKRVVEDPRPLAIVLEDVAHEEPRDTATVCGKVNDLGAARRGSSIDAPASLWRD